MNASSFRAIKTASEFEACMRRRNSRGAAKRVVVIDNGSPTFIVYLVPGRTDKFWREVQRRPNVSSGPGKAYVFALNHEAYVHELYDHEHADDIPVEALLKTESFLPWHVFPYRNAFVGYDSQDLASGGGSGNTVLLEAPRVGEYVLIRGDVRAFKSLAAPSRGVHTYVSEMERNNDVSYPYASDGQYVYFLASAPIAVPLKTPLLPEKLRADPNGWLYESSGLGRQPSLLERWFGVMEARRRSAGVVPLEVHQLHPCPA